MEDFKFAGQTAHTPDVTNVALVYCIGKEFHEPFRIYLERKQNSQLEEDYENKFSAVRRFLELTEITNSDYIA
jgi:hypothetical protein